MFTAKQKQQLGYIAAGGVAALLLYQFWTKTALKGQLQTAGQKCRRAAHDLLKLQGKSDVDAVNQAGDYCDVPGGELYKDSP